MAGIPLPRGYTGSGIQNTGSGIIVEPLTPSSSHRIEQYRSNRTSQLHSDALQEPKVEHRRYRPTSQLQQQQQHAPAPYASNTSLITPKSARGLAAVTPSWGDKPRPSNDNFGSWNTNGNSSNDNEGVGSKSCLTFPKHVMGSKNFRNNKGGATTITNSSVGSSTNSGARFSKTRSFLRRSTNGSGVSTNSRAATSSQSSQNSSNAAAGTSSNYRGSNRAQHLPQQQQQPYPTSDDEFENANSWLLKESSNYNPWSISGTYGESEKKPNRDDRSTAVISPESDTDIPNATNQGVERLLTLPAVEDRSDRKRIEYEQRLRNSIGAKHSNPRRRGLYEGELEPEGVRGQEARVVTTTSSTAASSQPYLPSSAGSSFQIIRPVTPSNSAGLQTSRRGSQQNALIDIPEESYDSSSVSNDPGTVSSPSANNVSNQQQHRTVTPASTVVSRGSIKSLHQHRPSRLVPPPPSRVKSSRHYNIPNESVKLSSNRDIVETETSTATDTAPMTQAHHLTYSERQEVSDSIRQREAIATSGDNNDIPWVRTSQINASQAPNDLRPQVRTRKVSTDSESSVGASQLPLQPSNIRQSLNGQMVQQNNASDDKKVENLHATASSAVRSGKFDVALTAFNSILIIQLERHGRSHAASAAAYHNLGTVYAKRASMVDNHDDDNDETQRQSRMAALECFQAAARCARDASPDMEHPHPNVAVSLVRVGFLLLQSKQYQNAIVTFQEALRIRITHYGKLHALSANLYNNLGVCCLHMGEFEQGLYHLEQALEIQRHLVNQTGRGSPKHQGNESAIAAHQLELADTLFNIGGLCLEWMRRQGPDARRADEAEAAFLECLQLRTHVLGQAHPQTLQVKSLYGIAKSVPRPRRILKTTPSPMMTTKSKPAVARTVDRDLTDENEPHRPIVHEAFDGFVETPHVRRMNRRSKSPVKIPAMSPIGPLSEVSSIANEDSNDATSIFRVGGLNNASPQRHEFHVMDESQPKNLQPPNLDANKLDRLSSNTEREPPLLQITVSHGEDETDNVYKSKETTASAGTHVYIAPHLVPESPHRRPADDSGDAQANEVSFDKDNFTVDTSSEMPRNTSNTSIVLAQASSYDTEENCIISDNGVDSEVGRIHYPLAWNRAGILQSNETGDQTNSTRRDIMVVQPIRQLQVNPDPLRRKQLDGRDKVSTSSTGNVERDDILARARAILSEHETNNVGNGSYDMDEEYEGASIEKAAASTLNHDVDDGIASLGGNWSSVKKTKTSNGQATQTIREMLRDPMSNLPEIHEEASRQFKSGNTVDAYRLFDVVLQCQRHLRGPLHPDVAAALHNVGIVQLRSQNHTEALKAFEEAARIRKGSLGKDHPLVAISLVKVGISLLLLHRFDDALWSFREALAVRKHALGPLHPSTARIYNNIGCVYVEFNEFKEARRAFEAALDVQRNALCNESENGPLMFGTATTLCNLGYLYRYRDMHGKAVAVLIEAVDLQERVLGPSHATVLSTLDNLADSCANSGNATEALKHYKVVLNRFRTNRTKQNGDSNSKLFRAEAVLLYKMSRVYRRQTKRDEQLQMLKLALQTIRQYSASSDGRIDTLERRIHYDIRAIREQSEKDELKWI